MAVKHKILINNTNAHMAIEDLLNSDIISPETRRIAEKMRRTLNHESQQLVDDQARDTAEPNSQAAD